MMKVLLFLSLMAWAQEGKEHRVDVVVAAVNGEAITWSALRLEMSLNQMDANDLLARRRALQTLIDRRLSLQYARNFTFITDAKVEEQIEKMSQTFPSREAFFESLSRRGMTLEEAREQVRESLMLLQLEARHFRPQIADVSPTDVEAYYIAHPEEFTVPERISVAQLLVRDGVETAQRLREALLAGTQTLEALATDPSSNAVVIPSTALRPASEFPSEFQERLKRLSAGEWSEPVETSQGIFLLGLLERRPAEVTPLSEVRGNIVKRIEEERLRAVAEAWLEDARKKADIRILDPTLQ